MARVFRSLRTLTRSSTWRMFIRPVAWARVGGPHFDYDSHVQTAPFLWSGPPGAAVRSRPVTLPRAMVFHRRR